MPELTPLEAAETLETAYGWQKNKGIPCVDAALFATSYLRRIAAGEYKQVVHAHWILDGSNPDRDPLIAVAIIENMSFRCSNCGDKIIGSKSKFCGACGAIMDEADMRQTQGGKDDSHA